MAVNNARIGPAERGFVYLSVVIPVFRNALTIRPLFDRLRTVLDPLGISYETVFVNDASPDDSMSVLRELARGEPRVLVVSLIRNVGQHAAVLTGINHCHGQWIVIMDGDLQDPPEAIPRLLDRARQGATVVFAARRGGYESPLRLVTSRIFKRFLGLLTGLPPDVGMFVLLDRGLSSKLLALRTSHPFVVAMIGCCRAVVATVPIHRNKRPAGKSAYTSLARLKAGITGLLCAIECRWLPRRKGVLAKLGPEIIGEMFSSAASLDYSAEPTARPGPDHQLPSPFHN